MDQVVIWSPRIAAAILVFIAFWIAARLSARVIQGLFKRSPVDVQVSDFLSSSARVLLKVIGAITALGTLGVDVTALVAGLGLTGFALGFALKDSISNLLAGVMILIYRPFELGQRISAGGHEGKVIKIDLRYTHLDRGDTTALIPNATMLNKTVVIEDAAGKGEHSQG